MTNRERELFNLGVRAMRDAAAKFVEDHVLHPYSQHPLQKKSDRQHRWTKHKPARVLYADGIRALELEA